MPPARASCWDEAGLALPGWCGQGVCVNGSAGGEGVPLCVCEPGWAHRPQMDPEDGATQCIIPLLRLRVELSVLLALTVVVAVLTARSVRLGALDKGRGFLALFGMGLMFASAAVALARGGGPETSVAGSGMRIVVTTAAGLCIVFLNAILGVDKYLKVIKRSAADVEGKGDDSGRRPKLERETMKALVLITLMWMVNATAQLAAWSSVASQCHSVLVYGCLICLANAWYYHAILRAIDADLAFVADNISSVEVIGKIDKLRRKVSIAHSTIVNPCILAVLMYAGLLVLDCSSAGYPVCQSINEIDIVTWLFIYIIYVVWQVRLKRNSNRRSITPDNSRSVVRASPSSPSPVQGPRLAIESNPSVSPSQSRLSKVTHADSENVSITPLVAFSSSTSTSVLVNVGHA